MTIIRSKVSQNFTIINNEVINDKEFDSRYLGVYLRLISKDPNWEVSISGLAQMYPCNRRDFYRSALKHMCKLGYLIRIPQPRVNGRFQKVVMELHDSRQIDTPLKDKEVDLLFGKEGLSEEEIQKIYPKRIFRHGFPDAENPIQQSTDEQSTDMSVLSRDEEEGENSGSIEYQTKEGRKYVSEDVIRNYLKDYSRRIQDQVIDVLRDKEEIISNLKAFCVKVAENTRRKTHVNASTRTDIRRGRCKSEGSEYTPRESLISREQWLQKHSKSEESLQ